MDGSEMSYSPGAVRQLIKKYQELRSVVQIVAMRYNRTSDRTENVSGREEILCMLLDIEQAALMLTKRQRQVCILMQLGYSSTDIAMVLKISTPTAKFHQNQAIDRISAYLNSVQAVRIKNRR
ncbi:MAG: LuxR C-terminal-related transcriptional regulator [Sporomusaceae bacterium]|nr:LuxR C-terminal-related transcriptional regulator [Sporomusaceae bacterium]